MRRLMATSIVLAAVFLSGLFAISGAQALTAPAPAALAPAIEQANPVQEIQYACRRVQRCGPNGCYWRRVCGDYRGGYDRAITREDTAGAITAAALVRRVGAFRTEPASRIAATEITSGAALVGGLFLISK